MTFPIVSAPMTKNGAVAPSQQQESDTCRNSEQGFSRNTNKTPHFI